MSSLTSNGQPRRDDNGLDWLSSDKEFTVSGEPGDLTVAFKTYGGDAVFTKRPPSGRLTFDFSSGLRLRTAPGVQIPDEFALRLMVNNGTEAQCLVEADIPHIECSAEQPTGRRVRHHLMLRSPANVAILGGDWYLEAPDEALVKPPHTPPAPIALRVENGETPLRIVTDLPVVELDSFGNHAFEFGREHDGAATFRVHDGTATFRRTLRGVDVEGGGSLRALGSVINCQVHLDGDVETHGEIEDSTIDISGDLLVHGSARFDGHDLRCCNAVFEAGVRASAGIVCERLQASGTVEIW